MLWKFDLKARTFFVVATVGLLLPGLLSAFVPPGHDKDLPNFDKRREKAEDKQAQRKEPPAARKAAAEKLAGRVYGLRVERDPLLQTPKHIFSTSGFLTGPNGEGRATSTQGARPFAVNDRYRGVKAFL